MKRALALLLLVAAVTFGRAETLVPLRIAQTFRASAPSTGAGSCVFGTSPNVLANDTGVNYRCDVTNAYVAMSSGGAVTGGGTAPQLAVWTGPTALGSSLARDDGSLFEVIGFDVGANNGAYLGVDPATLSGGGDYDARAGAAFETSAFGGTVRFTGGNADGIGGGVSFSGGDSVTSFGGDITFARGDGPSGPGAYYFEGDSGNQGILNFESLSTQRLYTFPDLAGTVALTSNKLSDFAATTSAELAGVVSDETGTGALVFADTPTLVTPVLGVATATSINKVAITAPATGSTLTIDDGFTLHATGNVTALSGSHTGTSSGTNTGDQTITLTGGVTGSGTGSFPATVVTNANLTGPVTSVGNATTITNKAVTLAKMDDVATSTVFYRKTAGTGVPEVNTLATLKTDLGLTGTNSGDQTITLTSDVTGSGTGSFATTIATGAVTSGKILDGTIAAADMGTGSVDVSSSVVTGTLAAGREPAHTGEVTNSAGSLALTIDKTITPTWTGLHTFQATISDLSTTANQFTQGYDSTHKLTWDTASDGATTATGTMGALTTGTGVFRVSPSGVTSMSSTSGAWDFRVDDLSGNQRFFVGRVTGPNALNHGVRMGFDSSNYLQFTAGFSAGGVGTFSLVGLTSLALPNPTTGTSPNWTTPTLTGTVTMTTGSFSGTAAAASDAFVYNTTATRNTSAKVLTFNDNSTEVYTVIKTASGYAQQSNYDLKLTLAGAGFYVKEGTNATMGTATANGTTAVTVSTTKVTANSRIFLTCNDPNGGTPGIEYVSTRTAGTSFAIKSSAGDTCIVAWIIVEPS